MHRFNLNIATRLRLAFGAVILMLLAIVALSFFAMQELNQSTGELARKSWPRVRAANLALDNVRGSFGRLAQLAVATDPAELKTATERLAANTAAFNKALGELDATLVTEESRASNTEAKALRDRYVGLSTRVLALSQAGQRDAALALAFGDAYAAMHKFAASLRAQVNLQEKHFDASADQADTVFLVSLKRMGGAALAALLLAVGAVIVITRSIVRPLAQAVQIARTVAAGDLTTDIRVVPGDETGQLMQALKDMNAALQTMVGAVRSGSDTIATAWAEIASGNLELSSRTEQQAASLEETASSMEEMTATVRQNAENADQANGLASTASGVARKGGMVVSQVVQTMGAINVSSRKIVDIIAVIDGIAFQTNILALNAAVEAARAGEQGRGFAVVASEVRNLAQRSASAAREIKTLIDDSVQQVEQGSKLVGDAGTTMQEVVASVQRVTDIMAQIASASREQDAGIEQINTAITEMDTVTQQNAALVEEAAAAAGSLQDQAAGLAQLVSRFKVGDTAFA
ncbi:methyl-accepting chemotaxis protein [Massilia sp. S19_KUP03_FR1]|uniref:methyl-accepting chemotaxis protein n=1 Tax=Massilia sp. S19_KUP03_FR1 TaxID=3025503 RepID=UPI002FCD7664